MKTLLAACLCTAVILSANNTSAAPMQYQFSAVHVSEGSSSGIPVAPADYLFADGTPITGTFFYDPVVTALAANVPASIFFPGRAGLSSFYNEVITGFSTSFEGQLFHTNISNSFVIDTDSADSSDAVLHYGTFAATNFTVGGWTLGQWEIFSTFALGPDFIGNQNLLPTPDAGPGTEFALLFSRDNNGATEYYFASFGNLEITPVPLPASAALFGGALLALWRPRRKSS